MSNEESIFAQALNQDPAERNAFLAQACAGNANLRHAVNALLLAHERAGGILESPPVPFEVTVHQSPPSEVVGSTVGPYKLLEPIGGGGMGVVYTAEQLRPVRRKVALKIIKPGMDSGQVIARFEAERQALTMMDHPNIAKVLDAGTTDAGRPYFVMELVKGIPITDYCDQARLTTRQRLELFMTVCHAVQHAHQKGVIHLDLKPGNVLVTLHDDKPVPKVIDFGIAKAAGQQLTEKRSSRTTRRSWGRRDLLILLHPQSTVRGVGWSPDGRKIAAAGGFSLHIYDASAGYEKTGAK